MCGNGVGVVGTGTLADCAEQQGATNPGGGSATPVAPIIVCGNGAGAVGTGSEAVCGSEAPSAAPSGSPPSEASPVVEVAPNVTTAPEAAASAAGGASGSLPRTGVGVLTLLAAALTMIAAGLVATRIQRRRTI